MRTQMCRAIVLALAVSCALEAQLVDRTLAPNAANDGINKSLSQQAGAGRGDWNTPDSSSFIISRDPFRSIRRGRQLFQRKFRRADGVGPVFGEAGGNPGAKIEIGAGFADSCAACHGRPRGAAGFGGDVVTRPDSRDAPHLFGLGLKEMLADEITADLRAQRAGALAEARKTGRRVERPLRAKGIDYGRLAARPDGTVDTAEVEGVDADLRVRPFFAHGGTISIREFIAGALQAEMGLQVVDPDLRQASGGGRVVTPAGMVLDGALDRIEAPPAADANADPDLDGVRNEIPSSIVDHLEFYLLNYFKAGSDEQGFSTRAGREIFERMGCARCHITNLRIDRDRRVADVETDYDPARGVFNRLFAVATPLFRTQSTGDGRPDLKLPKLEPFAVRDIFTDFKRHDLGPNFHERNYDGSMRTHFMTTPLWGVGSTPPYGHDGRSINLTAVILRHGGEAQRSGEHFANLSPIERGFLLDFLNSLIIFPPDDTASTLDPGNPADPLFPQKGHGSIRLTVLFNNPLDIE